MTINDGDKTWDCQLVRITFLSVLRKGRVSVKASAANDASREAVTLAGWVWEGSRLPNKAKTAEPSRFSRAWFGRGQSSSGIITVMAGCGWSMSRGPQWAISLIRRGRAVVVAHIHRKRQTVLSGLRLRGWQSGASRQCPKAFRLHPARSRWGARSQRRRKPCA